MAIIETKYRIEEAIKSIKDLLDCVNIRKIIYVDDKFDIEHQKEKIFAYLKSCKSEGKEVEGLEGINWSLPQAAFDGQLVKIWTEWNAEQKEKCFQAVSLKQEDIDVIPTGILEKICLNG